MSKGKTRTEKILYGVAGVVLLIILWEIAAVVSPNGLVPTPWSVVQLFCKIMVEPIGAYTLPFHVLFSLQRVFIGFAASAVVGIALGLLMARSKTANAVIKPIFEAIRPIPGLAWIPLSILWFGLGELSKYFIIFMGGLGHVTVNTEAGVRRVDNTLIGAARMLGVKENKLFTKVILPSIITNVFAGLQVSLSASWMSVIAAEMVSSREGAGWIIMRGIDTASMQQILVGMISIGIVGFILATIMRMIERGLDIWKGQD